MRKSAELWILERGAFHALEDLMEELEFQTAEKDRTPDLDDYFKRMRSIISATEKKWDSLAQPSEKSIPGVAPTSGSVSSGKSSPPAK
jgi:hypothetical protein